MIRVYIYIYLYVRTARKEPPFHGIILIYERQDLRVVEKCDGIPVFSSSRGGARMMIASVPIRAQKFEEEKMGGEVEKYVSLHKYRWCIFTILPAGKMCCGGKS